MREACYVRHLIGRVRRDLGHARHHACQGPDVSSAVPGEARYAAVRWGVQVLLEAAEDLADLLREQVEIGHGVGEGVVVLQSQERA